MPGRLNVSPAGVHERSEPARFDYAARRPQVYLKWHVLHGAAAVLPKAFVDADFEFFSRTLLGQQREQPRWRRCVTRTDEQLGDALGQAFVADTFGPQAKEDMLTMVRGIKAALARDMNDLTWMNEATKKAALEKLQRRRRSDRLSRQVARLLRAPPGAGRGIRESSPDS